MTDITKVGEF